MATVTEKLDKILESLARLEKHHKITPNKETTITDFEESISSYEEFGIEELKLEQITINNHKSVIRNFLNHSKGIINNQSVKVYLESNESLSWKSNQIKALRRYVRDYLKLGNWINEFVFTKAKAKRKDEIPSNEQLTKFCELLPYQTQIVFLVMFSSGLRIGEVLSLRFSNVHFETNLIDASNLHSGETKSSWFSFVTKQTSKYLESYMGNTEYDENDDNPKFFSVSARSVQQAFKKESKQMGISINPHLLRTVFAEKCREAKIDKEYIDAFCGRVPQGILAKNYTVYSPESLRKQYDKVEPFLTLTA